MVYVPAGWHHAVLNLELSVAFSQNFLSKEALPSTWALLRTRHPAFGATVRDLLARDDPTLAAKLAPPAPVLGQSDAGAAHGAAASDFGGASLPLLWRHTAQAEKSGSGAAFAAPAAAITAVATAASPAAAVAAAIAVVATAATPAAAVAAAASPAAAVAAAIAAVATAATPAAAAVAAAIAAIAAAASPAAAVTAGTAPGVGSGGGSKGGGWGGGRYGGGGVGGGGEGGGERGDGDCGDVAAAAVAASVLYVEEAWLAQLVAGRPSAASAVEQRTAAPLLAYHTQLAVLAATVAQRRARLCLLLARQERSDAPRAALRKALAEHGMGWCAELPNGASLADGLSGGGGHEWAVLRSDDRLAAATDVLGSLLTLPLVNVRLSVGEEAEHGLELVTTRGVGMDSVVLEVPLSLCAVAPAAVGNEPAAADAEERSLRTTLLCGAAPLRDYFRRMAPLERVAPTAIGCWPELFPAAAARVSNSVALARARGWRARTLREKETGGADALAAAAISPATIAAALAAPTLAAATEPRAANPAALGADEAAAQDEWLWACLVARGKSRVAWDADAEARREEEGEEDDCGSNVGPASEDPAPGRRVLCPLVDLASHDTGDANATLELHAMGCGCAACALRPKHEGCVRLVASCAIKAQLPVRVCYDPEAEFSDLFERHGLFDSTAEVRTVEVLPTGPLAFALLAGSAVAHRAGDLVDGLLQVEVNGERPTSSPGTGATANGAGGGGGAGGGEGGRLGLRTGSAGGADGGGDSGDGGGGGAGEGGGTCGGKGGDGSGGGVGGGDGGGAAGSERWRAELVSSLAEMGRDDATGGWWVPDHQPLSCPLLGAVRAVLVGAAEMAELQSAAPDEAPHAPLLGPIARETEARALFGGLLRAHLAGYGTTLEEDRAEEEEGARLGAEAEAAALHFAAYEKTLLRDVLGAL